MPNSFPINACADLLTLVIAFTIFQHILLHVKYDDFFNHKA